MHWSPRISGDLASNGAVDQLPGQASVGRVHGAPDGGLGSGEVPLECPGGGGVGDREARWPAPIRPITAELVRRWATWALQPDIAGPVPRQDDDVFRQALRGGPVLPPGPDTRDPQSR